VLSPRTAMSAYRCEADSIEVRLAASMSAAPWQVWPSAAGPRSAMETKQEPR